MVAQIDNHYKEAGKKRVLRRLMSYAIFEGRPHTTKGQWFNPFVFIFLKALSRMPGEVTISKPIFITGIGRSGTTILGKVFSIHKDAGFLNEPKAIWKLIDARHDINGDYVFAGGTYHLNRNDVTPKARKQAHRIFSKYLSLTGATRLVDKYPELIFRVDYLLELFPDARIIFISRNGNDAANSIDLWSKRLGTENKGNIEDWWGRNDIKWQYIRQQIINIDPAYSSIRKVATSNLDHLNRAAIEWIITMREGINQHSLFPDSIYHLKYEELTNDIDHTLKSLLNWCQLDHDPKLYEYANKALYSNPVKPEPDLIPSVSTLFNQTMEQLGYKQTNQANND